MKKLVTAAAVTAATAALTLAPTSAAHAAQTHPSRSGVVLECNVGHGPVCREMGAPRGGLTLAKCKEYQWVQYASSRRTWPTHKVTATGCHRIGSTYGYLVRVYR